MNTDRNLERTALFTVMTTSFMTTFMGSSINLALPTMGNELGSNAIITSWIITAYILASAVFLLPFGRLADIKGRRKVYLTGTILYSVFTLLVPLASSVQMIIVLRVLQGLSAAMIFGTGMAILSAVFPPQRRGKALGYSVSVTYLGLSVGPVVGGMMNQHLGWKSIFYVAAIFGFAAAYSAFAKLKGEWIGAPGEKFDVAGALLYIMGLMAFLYGLSSLETLHWAVYLVVAGLILLAVFVKWETKTTQPILEIHMFKNNLAFTMSNLAALINYSATFAVTFLLSLYLQVVRGYSSQTAGLILLAQPLMMALLSPLAGSLSDKIEPRKVASLGMACSALSLFFFSFLQMDTSVLLLAGILVLAGIGFALFSSPNNNAIMGSVNMRLYGIASSILGTMRLVGQACSMSIVTLLVAVFVGQVALDTADPVNLMIMIRVAFIVFTFLCLFGIAASLARGSLHEAGEGETNS